MKSTEIFFTLFIIATNTIIQLAISKKDIRLFILVWIRDIISASIMIYLGIYWQVYIILWQFVLTISGYLCWKHEDKHGVKINQIQLFKITWQQFSHTIAKSVKQKRSKT